MLYILDQDANLPLFSFHLHVCSYRFLQERSLMIPMQEQQRLVEKAVYPFLRAHLRRSSHRGDKVQMIFDPLSNILMETSALLGIPWSWTVGRLPKNTRTEKKNFCYSGYIFYGEEPK